MGFDFRYSSLIGIHYPTDIVECIAWDSQREAEAGLQLQQTSSSLERAPGLELGLELEPGLAPELEPAPFVSDPVGSYTCPMAGH